MARGDEVDEACVSRYDESDIMVYGGDDIALDFAPWSDGDIRTNGNVGFFRNSNTGSKTTHASIGWLLNSSRGGSVGASARSGLSFDIMLPRAAASVCDVSSSEIS